jgi:protein-S-isoprenylcysteine O-methyltransferase Ste14
VVPGLVGTRPHDRPCMPNDMPPNASKWILVQLFISAFVLLLLVSVGLHSQSESLPWISTLFVMQAGVGGATYAAVRELEKWVARVERARVEQAREEQP